MAVPRGWIVAGPKRGHSITRRAKLHFSVRHARSDRPSGSVHRVPDMSDLQSRLHYSRMAESGPREGPYRAALPSV